MASLDPGTSGDDLLTQHDGVYKVQHAAVVFALNHGRY